jgi:hypothetical protein
MQLCGRHRDRHTQRLRTQSCITYVNTSLSLAEQLCTVQEAVALARSQILIVSTYALRSFFSLFTSAYYCMIPDW